MAVGVSVQGCLLGLLLRSPFNFLAMAGKNAPKKPVQPATEPLAAVTPAPEPPAAVTPAPAALNFKAWRDLVSEQNFFVSVTFSIPHRNIHTSALSVAIVAEV